MESVLGSFQFGLNNFAENLGKNDMSGILIIYFYRPNFSLVHIPNFFIIAELGVGYIYYYC